jgi:uncharacterized membrane protein
VSLDLLPWIQLAVRWFHLVAGIAWIGASFHFIWLDNSLRRPKVPAPGVAGEAWLVHGGGFYHDQKYLVAPAHLPEHLHWFKWEAYSTWLSGFALLILIYYLGAELYLVDPAKAALTGWQATAVGVGALVAGWLVYDGLCRSPLRDNAPALALFWFLIMTAAAWGLTQVLSDRGAVIHVGAMIGTVMVANVFLVIIPNQTKAVAAMARGEAPDPRLGQEAKQRSLHNNYMTLPVLLMMISNHFPMVVGSDYNWAILAGLSAISLLIRHFFNLKHRGELHWELVGWAGAGGLAIALFASAERAASVPPPLEIESLTSEEASVQSIISRHCASCHAYHPTHPAFAEAPNGVVLDTLASVRLRAPQVYEQAVAAELMPLGNQTGMTAEERRILGAWLGERADDGAD